MQLDLSGPNYKRAAPVIAFHNELLDRIKQIPGVASASTRSFVPIAPDASFSLVLFAIEGRPRDLTSRPRAFQNTISPEYFETMKIPLIKGRRFDERDARKAPKVAIINETLAARYFPGEDPIGKRVTLEDDNPPPESWATIVGVVGDTKQRALESEPVTEMYMPFAQETMPFMALMIRATADPASVSAQVRNEVQSLDKDQPVYSIRTLSSILSESVATPRFRTLLLAIFAAIALTLAAVGIYGVISYSVTQRTHEIGVRMALGAQQKDVLKMVVGQGMLLTLAGVGIGLVASFFLTRLLSGLLFNVSATDTLTFAAVSVLLAGVALAACAVPARRATKVDPCVALRHE